MEFKAKLRKIGNSLGVIIPKNVITNLKAGEIININVITSKSDNVITSTNKSQKVITSKPHKRLVFNVKTGLNEWV